MMTTYEEHVWQLAAWRDEIDQWLTGRNVPTGDGAVNKPANGAVVMDVSTRSAELTVALLESAAPVAALWDPSGDEEEQTLTFYSQKSGWMSVDCAVPVTEGGEAIDEEEDGDDWPTGPQFSEELAAELKALLEPFARELLDAIPMRHTQKDVSQLREKAIANAEKAFPERKVEIRAFADGFGYGDWWYEQTQLMWNRHRQHWREHAEDLARAVDESQVVTATTKSELDGIVWEYLKAIDPCVNKSVGRPAVNILQKWVKERQGA